MINFNIMRKQPSQLTIAQLLKEALAGVESVRAVSRATGIAQPSLARFLSGKQSLHLDSADKLVRFFGIKIVRPPRRAKKGR